MGEGPRVSAATGTSSLYKSVCPSLKSLRLSLSLFADPCAPPPLSCLQTHGSPITHGRRPLRDPTAGPCPGSPQNHCLFQRKAPPEGTAYVRARYLPLVRRHTGPPSHTDASPFMDPERTTWVPRSYENAHLPRTPLGPRHSPTVGS